MADDPRPQFRCRCVHRELLFPDLAHLLTTSDYEHRCHQRPTQEDGLCDHCRQPEGCACCSPAVVAAPGGGCRWHDSNRRLVDLTTPCAALEVSA